jgi:hypothetical protein
VVNAPIGAARLNANKIRRTAPVDRPSANKTATIPKAAGALCTIIARKIISANDSLPPVSWWVAWVDEAPRAIPSATECVRRPITVENEWDWSLTFFVRLLSLISGLPSPKSSRPSSFKPSGSSSSSSSCSALGEGWEGPDKRPV